MSTSDKLSERIEQLKNNLEQNRQQYKAIEDEAKVLVQLKPQPFARLKELSLKSQELNASYSSIANQLAELQQQQDTQLAILEESPSKGFVLGIGETAFGPAGGTAIRLLFDQVRANLDEIDPQGQAIIKPILDAMQFLGTKTSINEQDGDALIQLIGGNIVKIMQWIVSALPLNPDAAAQVMATRIGAISAVGVGASVLTRHETFLDTGLGNLFQVGLQPAFNASVVAPIESVLRRLFRFSTLSVNAMLRTSIFEAFTFEDALDTGFRSGLTNKELYKMVKAKILLNVKESHRDFVTEDRIIFNAEEGAFSDAVRDLKNLINEQLREVTDIMEDEQVIFDKRMKVDVDSLVKDLEGVIAPPPKSKKK